MKKVLLFTLCGCVAASSATFAQSTRPRYASRDKTAIAESRTLMDDRAFVLSAAQGGIATIELGRLALTRAASADVRQFTQSVIQVSEKMNEELKPLLEVRDVPAPGAIDSRHKVSYDWLSKLAGSDFDRAYMTVMTAKHANDVTFFQHAAAVSKQPDVQAWAAKTLPAIKQHHTMAREVGDKIVGVPATTPK